MDDTAKSIVADAQSIIIVQAENPDGDSLGSSLALEEILESQSKKVLLHCPVEIPKYLRYIKGWDRVTPEYDTSADAVIIVDTAADVLLSKTLNIPGVRHHLESHPVLVIDHHTTTSNLSFSHTILSDEATATSEVIYKFASSNNWSISADAAENMMIAIMSDSLGLTTQNVTPQTFFTVGKLAELGARNSAIEERRREFMKKSAAILAYKGELIGRIEYYLNGKLALIHIPWEDIQNYSDQYNPSMLVLDEMRLVEGVEIAIAIKTYPDGKVTGKLRSNLPIAEAVAGYFGGGGHSYAAGFRAYEQYDTIVAELLTATQKALTEYEATT